MPKPVAVNVKVGLPAETEPGDRDVICKGCVPPPVIVSCIAFEVVVSDFMILMLTDPAVVSFEADTDEVSCVLETTVVA
jgi:hypothetical protein